MQRAHAYGGKVIATVVNEKHARSAGTYPHKHDIMYVCAYICIHTKVIAIAVNEKHARNAGMYTYKNDMVYVCADINMILCMYVHIHVYTRRERKACA